MKLNNNDDSHNSGLNLLIYNMLLDIESHPAWVCGLKLFFVSIFEIYLGHTLRGCVDWNNLLRTWNEPLKSHPAWVCGLKHSRDFDFVADGSHTLRGCVDWNLIRVAVGIIETRHTLRGCVDWNLAVVADNHFGKVTPCVGVWIETWFPRRLWYDRGVTPCVGVWIETFGQLVYFANKRSHTLRGCVDWNIISDDGREQIAGHTLRGCVDWNNKNVRPWLCGVVTPCVGVWIETFSLPFSPSKS